MKQFNSDFILMYGVWFKDLAFKPELVWGEEFFGARKDAAPGNPKPVYEHADDFLDAILEGNDTLEWSFCEPENDYCIGISAEYPWDTPESVWKIKDEEDAKDYIAKLLTPFTNNSEKEIRKRCGRIDCVPKGAEYDGEGDASYFFGVNVKYAPPQVKEGYANANGVIDCAEDFAAIVKDPLIYGGDDIFGRMVGLKPDFAWEIPEEMKLLRTEDAARKYIAEALAPYFDSTEEEIADACVYDIIGGGAPY